MVHRQFNYTSMANINLWKLSTHANDTRLSPKLQCFATENHQSLIPPGSYLPYHRTFQWGTTVQCTVTKGVSKEWQLTVETSE